MRVGLLMAAEAGHVHNAGRRERLAWTALAPAGSQLVLAEWTAPGGAGGEPVYQAPLHAHPEDEAWYVLEGLLAVRAGEQVHQVSAGGAVVVPGGTAHTYWNPRPGPTRYVLVMGSRTFALIPGHPRHR